MVTTVSPMGRHARRGYILAIVLGLLSLVDVFFMPLAGLFSGALYGAVAWGIRKRRAGAPLMCALQYLTTIALAATALSDPSRNGERVAMMSGIVLFLVFSWLLFRAALELRSDPGRKGPDWPWYVVLASTLLFSLCTGQYSMPSVSMQNTIMSGDYVLVDKTSHRLGRDPHRGDILVFRYPLNHDEIYVKRVAGIPGDRLHLVHKQLYRNGALVTEPYAIHITKFEDPYRDNFPAQPSVPLQEPARKMLEESMADGDIKVPAVKYFVLGDNRDDSADSRYWGFVDRSEIIGRPFLIYASNEVKGSELRSILNTRWSRLLTWL